VTISFPNKRTDPSEDALLNLLNSKTRDCTCKENKNEGFRELRGRKRNISSDDVASATIKRAPTSTVDVAGKQPPYKKTNPVPVKNVFAHLRTETESHTWGIMTLAPNPAISRSRPAREGN